MKAEVPLYFGAMALSVGTACGGAAPVVDHAGNAHDRAAFLSPEEVVTGAGRPFDPGLYDENWTRRFYGETAWLPMWQVDHSFRSLSAADCPQSFSALAVTEYVTRGRTESGARMEYKGVDPPDTRPETARCGEAVRRVDDALTWGAEHWCFQMQSPTEPRGDGIWCAARKGTLVINVSIMGSPLYEPGAVDRLYGDRLAKLETSTPTDGP